MAFDFWILDFIQTYLRSGFGDVFMPFITKFGDGGIFWILFTVVLLLIPKTRRIGGVVAVSVIIEALCCNVILKPLVARVRPYDVREGIILLVNAPRDFSFPSGHTGVSFAVVSGLYFGRKYLEKILLWIPALVLSVLIALSRLYLYVHYPTDVLAGMVIGIAAGWLGSLLVKLALDKMSSAKQ